MKIILTFYLTLFSLLSFAQQHNYSYDASGNRIKREYIVLYPSNPLREKAPQDSAVVELKAYPNPFSEQVTITLESEEDLEGNERLLLYNMNGQLIQEFSMNQKTKTIQTQELAKGKYILQLIRNEESNSFILIKN